MDFFSSSTADLAQVDSSQLEFLPDADHQPLMQASGSYMQHPLPSDDSVNIQDYASYQSNLPPVLPSPQLQTSESTSNAQFVFAVPSKTMGPPIQQRKRKAPTIRAEDWEPYKSRILQLREQNLPLPKLIEIIEAEHGFIASLKQYQRRISQWGQDKNVKTQEMQAIVRKRQKRKLVETDKRELIFQVRDSRVQPQKIERWMQRHDVIESALYAPSPAASTPSAVECYTISERDSPAPISLHSLSALIFSPGSAHFAAMSPHMSSPALSVSSILRPQENAFAGQSPAPTYQVLPSFPSSSTYSTSAFQNQNDTVVQPRYLQAKEEALRRQLHEAEILGTSFLRLSEILHELTSVLIIQGRYKTAEEMTYRLFDAIQSQNGDGDEDKSLINLMALHLLGSLRKEQGLYLKAEKLFRQVLKEREKILGPEHPNTLATINNLGSVLINMEKNDEAEALHRRVLVTQEKVLGLEHPETLTTINDLGLVLSKMGKHDEAEALHRRALVVKEVLGPEHPKTLVSISNFGFLLFEMGNYNEAEILVRRASEGSKKVLGSEHPQTLIYTANLVATLERQGRRQEAISLLKRCVEAGKRVLGVDHPYTKSSIKMLDKWCAEST